MTHYFSPPSTFRPINPKSVPGERARKNCRKWNKLVNLLNHAKKINDSEAIQNIQNQLHEF
jgi:hypothetical protein